jgi:hypothetical protein
MILGTLFTANYAAGVVASTAVLVVLSLANGKNAILFPPGPPAHWFWSNALPSVKWVF